ncbi:MAG: outer membrane beta-barrel protein [Nannocystaceae bacterium]
MLESIAALLLFAPAGPTVAPGDTVHPATRAYVGPREVAPPPGELPEDPRPTAAPDSRASATPRTTAVAATPHDGERPTAPAMSRSADETLVRRVTRPGDSDVRRTWVVGGFVDASYVVNSNSPDNHINRGMGTAPRSGEFGVPLAVAYIRHDADRREPWFLELALQVGPAATALVLTDPQPGGDASRLAGATVWQHLGRANAGIRIPKSRTEIGGGVFGTPIGYWSFWAKDNWTYSTPWHLNAVPYVLMGLRVLQPIGRKLLLQAWVHNGWATYADINKAPSYLGGAIVEPVAGLHLGQFFHFGPEDTDIRARAWRMLSDTWMAFERGRFGLVAVFDVMRERVTSQPGEPVALYMTGAISPRVRVLERRGGRIAWWLAARGETFWDRHGRIYGVDQLLGSAVASSDLRLFEFVQLRVEYRFDASTAQQGFFYRGAAIHDSDGGLAQQQHAVYFALIGTFEHWFGRRARPR